MLNQVQKKLNSRERKRIFSPFGINSAFEKILQELGEALNLNCEYVRQIQIIAFNKIKLGYGEHLVGFLYKLFVPVAITQKDIRPVNKMNYCLERNVCLDGPILTKSWEKPMSAVNEMTFSMALALLFGYMEGNFTVQVKVRAVKFKSGKIIGSCFKHPLHFKMPLITDLRKSNNKVLVQDLDTEHFLTAKWVP